MPSSRWTKTRKRIREAKAKGSKTDRTLLDREPARKVLKEAAQDLKTSRAEMAAEMTCSKPRNPAT